MTTSMTDWLSHLEGVRAASVRHLGADLADLSASAERYRRLVDALLATPADRPETAADALVEINVELQHVAWHIRSATRRIDRLASDLYAERDEPSTAPSEVKHQ